MDLQKLLPVLGVGCLVMMGLGCGGGGGSVDPCLTLCEREATCPDAAPGKLAQCRAECTSARTEAARYSCVDKLDALSQCHLAADVCNVHEPRCQEEQAAAEACPQDYCTNTPAAPACDPEYCNKNPLAPECKAEFCRKNPTATGCNGSVESDACLDLCDKVANCSDTTAEETAECKQACPELAANLQAIACWKPYEDLVQCQMEIDVCSEEATETCEPQALAAFACIMTYCKSNQTDPVCALE